MTPTDGERIAVVETEVRGLREDVQGLTREQERTRQRVHALEATTNGFVKLSEGRAQQQADDSARLQRWVKVLTFVVAAAALIEPLILHGRGV